MARLQTQEASGSTNLDDDMDSPARCKGETRDSMDSNHGAPRVAGTALRSQLADIKVGGGFELGAVACMGGGGGG